MMQIQSLLTQSRTLCDIEGVSKKRVLEILASTISQDIPEIDTDDLFRRLVARERLGSTGIGHGIAIPHCRIDKCDRPIGALITLNQSIDFDSIDAEPVDIVFAMLVPENADGEHLQNLATLAGALNNASFREQLRSANSDAALYEIAVQ